jgi:serine protease Do
MHRAHHAAAHFSPTRTPIRLALLALACAAPLVCASPALADDRASGAASPDAPANSAVADAQLALATGFSEAFEKVAADVSPSVVNITATYGATQSPQQRMTDEDLFRHFFGGGPFGPMQPQQRRGQSFGSGVIVRADGHILTNAHVVDGKPDRVQVRLSNDKLYEATIVGADPDTDIAVLKIDAPDLTVAKLGDLARVKPGQWVLAIGSPFNLSQTVTAGIVSAVNRAGVAPGNPRGNGRGAGSEARYDSFIQTDASINPGNSGGPLVNLRGEVIGINSAIYTPSRGSVGIGFAIPINLAESIMDSLLTTGKVKQGGRLGVSIQDLTDDLAKSLGHAGTSGVLINQVEEGSPAEAAGLKVEDIITAVNALPTPDAGSLRTLVSRIAPGQVATLSVVRAGKSMELRVTVGESAPEPVAQTGNTLGVAVRAITPDETRALRLRAGVGVIVSELAEDSPLQQFGVQPGYAIVQINGISIASPEDLEKVLQSVQTGRLTRVRVIGPGGQNGIFTFVP